MHSSINPPAEMRKNGIYTFAPLDFGFDDFRKTYERVLGPLTLFTKSEDEADIPVAHLERPVTPINDEIKSAPKMYCKLAEYICRRVRPNADVEHMTSSEQEELAKIILGEVNFIWPDIRQQSSDPFLTPAENREVLRHVTVHVVTVCQILFQHYVQKLQVLNKRGIFTGPANFTRLKAQLGIDTNKFLNISVIRRNILADIKNEKSEPVKCSPTSDLSATIGGVELDNSSAPHWLPSHSSMMNVGHRKPLKHISTNLFLNSQLEIGQMMESMPDLEVEKLCSLVSSLPPFEDGLLDEETKIASTLGILENYEDLSNCNRSASKSEQEPQPRKHQRSHSLVEESCPGNLLTELGIIISGRKSPVLSRDVGQTKSFSEVESKTYAERNADDLQKLVCHDKSSSDIEEDSLAPLLQALLRSSKHDNRKEQLDKQLQDLEERERRDDWSVEQTMVHAQPATVSEQMPNKMLVHASDVRVSNRVCLLPATLHRYETFYNDLNNEVNAETVKKLDHNLYLGEEMFEVFEKISKSLPKDFLELDSDSYIEPSAEDVHLKISTASSTLQRKPDERIINRELRQNIGSQSTPDDGMQPKVSITANSQSTQHGVNVTPAFPANTKTRQLLSKSYSSWSKLWKDTINTDDYMKFISAQDTDYLGVLYHFYNSDEEGSDADEKFDRTGNLKSRERQQKRTSANSISLEQREKLKELLEKKKEFSPGFWNANSILLGGLGKDPEIENQEEKLNDIGGNKTEPPQKRPKSGLYTSMQLRCKDSDETKSSKPGTTGSGKTNNSRESNLLLQERLEMVWTSLQMPDKLKLDMAVKYSFDAYHAKLEPAVLKWENVTKLILRREALLAEQEQFERIASEPNRFFQKGWKGSSRTRLNEASARALFAQKLSAMEMKIKEKIDEIEKEFQDVITYQGQIYRDKMQSDYTEMLYYLQEERKQEILSQEIRAKQLPPIADHLLLPPICLTE